MKERLFHLFPVVVFWERFQGQPKCHALRNLVLFVQFKKLEKHPRRSVTLRKVAEYLKCVWLWFFSKLFVDFNYLSNVNFVWVYYCRKLAHLFIKNYKDFLQGSIPEFLKKVLKARILLDKVKIWQTSNGYYQIHEKWNVLGLVSKN